MDPASLAGSLTGVFVGLSHDDYTVLTRDAGVLDDAYGFTGTPFSMASGRISYTLGVQRSVADGRHRVLVRAARRPPGLPQPGRPVRATWRWPGLPW